MRVQDLLTRPRCDCGHVMSLQRVERWREDGYMHSKYIWRCLHCSAMKYERV